MKTKEYSGEGKLGRIVNRAVYDGDKNVPLIMVPRGIASAVISFFGMVLHDYGYPMLSWFFVSLCISIIFAWYESEKE